MAVFHTKATTAIVRTSVAELDHFRLAQVQGVNRVAEPACFRTAPAPGILNPEPAPAPGKREQKFGFFIN